MRRCVPPVSLHLLQNDHMVLHHEQLRPDFHPLQASDLPADPGAEAHGPPAAMETIPFIHPEPSALAGRPVKPPPTLLERPRGERGSEADSFNCTQRWRAFLHSPLL